MVQLANSKLCFRQKSNNHQTTAESLVVIDSMNQDMALRLTFSPCPMDEDDVMMLMTPKRKSPAYVPSNCCTPQTETSSIRKSLFSERCEEDEDESVTPMNAKRMKRFHIPIRRALSMGDSPLTSNQPASAAESNHGVMTAVNRFTENDDLVGDGSGSFCLPTIKGKHSDLKSISPQTMVDVLQGQYDNSINSYRVVDCRYPYEYRGGHIKDAENLYTHEQIQELLQGKPITINPAKRDVLIFHCEFSSERGPKMLRFLRAQDRSNNQQNYPSLCYPEIYILDGGYKAFFNTQQSLCSPMTYTPMLHQDHSADLRHFRTKSKSWTAGQKKRSAKRLRV